MVYSRTKTKGTDALGVPCLVAVSILVRDCAEAHRGERIRVKAECTLKVHIGQVGWVLVGGLHQLEREKSVMRNPTPEMEGKALRSRANHAIK